MKFKKNIKIGFDSVLCVSIYIDLQSGGWMMPIDRASDSDVS